MEPTPESTAEQQVGEIEMEISPEGMGLSVIRWFQSLRPLEQLETLQD